MTITAAAMPAAAFDASVDMPADMAPPAVMPPAAPAAAAPAMPPAAAHRRPDEDTAALAAPPKPSFAIHSFLKISSGPIG